MNDASPKFSDEAIQTLEHILEAARGGAIPKDPPLPIAMDRWIEDYFDTREAFRSYIEDAESEQHELRVLAGAAQRFADALAGLSRGRPTVGDSTSNARLALALGLHLQGSASQTRGAGGLVEAETWADSEACAAVEAYLGTIAEGARRIADACKGTSRERPNADEESAKSTGGGEMTDVALYPERDAISTFKKTKTALRFAAGNLAVIFWHYSGRQPSRITDVETGWSVGYFHEFVDRAMAVLPETGNVEHLLRIVTDPAKTNFMESWEASEALFSSFMSAR